MTTRRLLEYLDDDAEALGALEAVSAGRGWCNLTPQVSAEDVDVLGVNVLSLRVKRGAPIATYVSSPSKRGQPRAGTLGVLHTRGRLGAARIDELLDGAPFALRQDHQQRGMLLDVPPESPPAEVLACMQRLLVALCDYERTGRWRLEVFERA